MPGTEGWLATRISPALLPAMMVKPAACHVSRDSNIAGLLNRCARSNAAGSALTTVLFGAVSGSAALVLATGAGFSAGAGAGAGAGAKVGAGVAFTAGGCGGGATFTADFAIEVGFAAEVGFAIEVGFEVAAIGLDGAAGLIGVAAATSSDGAADLCLCRCRRPFSSARLPARLPMSAPRPRWDRASSLPARFAISAMFPTITACRR